MCQPRLGGPDLWPGTIRVEGPDDHDAIRRLVSAAFASDDEADLVGRIRASPGYIADLALVATADDEPLGRVMASGAILRSAHEERSVSMLSAIAVRPDRQRQGIDGALVEAVLAIADQRGEPEVLLAVTSALGRASWMKRRSSSNLGMTGGSSATAAVDDSVRSQIADQTVRTPQSPWRRAAVRVFSIRQAIVIGPVPPGIGVIQPATSATGS